MVAQLWRFETVVYKNKTGSDPAQVPAAATINLYRQGATVSQAASIPVTINDPEPQPTTISVYDAGALAVFDLLQVNSNGSTSIQVNEVTSRTSIKVVQYQNEE